MRSTASVCMKGCFKRHTYLTIEEWNWYFFFTFLRKKDRYDPIWPSQTILWRPYTETCFFFVSFFSLFPIIILNNQLKQQCWAPPPRWMHHLLPHFVLTFFTQWPQIKFWTSDASLMKLPCLLSLMSPPPSALLVCVSSQQVQSCRQRRTMQAQDECCGACLHAFVPTP